MRGSGQPDGVVQATGNKFQELNSGSPTSGHVELNEFFF